MLLILRHLEAQITSGNDGLQLNISLQTIPAVANRINQYLDEVTLKGVGSRIIRRVLLLSRRKVAMMQK